MTDAKKYLSGLTLLDRFLFAEAVEDQEVMQLILEIILGQEIHLAGPPQTEKEARRSPQYRHIRLESGQRIRTTASMTPKFKTATPATCPGAAATTRAISTPHN